MTKIPNLLKAFETEALRVVLFQDMNGLFYYKEVGMLATNEHEMIKEFNTFEEANEFYGNIFNVLKYNGVEILKTF